MSTLQDIKKALSNFSHSELKSFRTWFEEFDNELWDKQFEQDSISKKLDLISKDALTDYYNNKCTEL